MQLDTKQRTWSARKQNAFYRAYCALQEVQCRNLALKLNITNLEAFHKIVKAHKLGNATFFGSESL